MSATRTNPFRAAFTLVEVMIAAAVIALGILGLFALFAGAARVQQTSSQTAASVQIAKNAQAQLRPLLSRLEVPDASVSLTGDLFQFNAWNMAYMAPDPWNYLTLGNPGAGDQAVYAVVENIAPLPYEFYSVDATLAQGRVGSGTLTALSGFPEFDPFFPERRVIPDNLRITVEYGDPSGGNWSGLDEVSYDRAGFSYPPDPDNPEPGSGSTPSNIILYGPGDPAVVGPSGPNLQDRNYITIDIEDTPQGTELARITSMRIDPVADPGNPNAVKSIRIDDRYFWKNDNLASLNDRITYRRDPDNPGERIPQYCYSLLYRKLGPTGAAQGAIYVYALQAPSATAEWMPSEEVGDIGTDRTPIQEVNLTLAWDDDAKQYYFQTQEEEDKWALAPGNFLLVRSTTSGATQGADEPVQVVRRAFSEDPEGGLLPGYRGYVDRAPRINSSAILPNFSDTMMLPVFALRDVVPSAADGSRWRLFPLNVQTFQIGD